jgi:thymidylate kinase
MKLALIGTHGVGKTTLAYDVCALLKKAGRNVELVTEVARRNPFPINEATTLESQLWILHTQIADELAAAQHAPWVICDRSVLDNYCYLVNKCGRQAGLEGWLERWLESYTLLVGVPLVRESIYSEGFRQPTLADGLRATDRAFQQRIDALIKELLTEAPFERFAERVLWLDGIRQSQWAETVFAAIKSGPAKKTPVESGTGAVTQPG